MTQTIKQVQSGSIKGSSQIQVHNTPVHQTETGISNHSADHQVCRKVHFRAPSVHGGSGGKGISISRHLSHGCSSGTVFGYGYGYGNHFGNHGLQGGFKNDGLFSFNEKETMQLLNSRLASYMKKVCSLEKENSHLESNIKEWYEKNQPYGLPDVSNYYRTIKELQNQIPKAYLENTKIFLDMDNTKMASDDIRNKLELELRVRNNIEADINGLRRVLERINMEICESGIYVQSLQDELQELQKNHEEEVNCLRTQLGARVSVEVNAAPSVDLNKVLSDIQQEYENLLNRNLREVEEIFLARTEVLNNEMVSGAEQLESCNSNLIELRRSVQTLEIELHSHLSMNIALENSLTETEANFSSELAQLQSLINDTESELAQVRCDLAQLNAEYKILMDKKSHLEMEISTYKRLLDGQGYDILDAVHHNSTETDHGVNVQHETEHVHQVLTLTQNA